MKKKPLKKHREYKNAKVNGFYHVTFIRNLLGLKKQMTRLDVFPMI